MKQYLDVFWLKNWNLCLKNGNLSLWTPREDMGDLLLVGGLETFF